MKARNEEAPSAPTLEASGNVINDQEENVMDNAIGTAVENKAEAALVRVFLGEIGGVPANVCDARELHAYLQSGDKFADWIKARIEKYGFEENRDFALVSANSEIKKGRGGDRRSRDYHLSLDMAKELGMVENNAQGRKVRRYFIECEQRLRDIAPAVADTVLNTTIGTDGFRCLAAVVDGKVRALPAPVRRRAKAKLWAQLHGAFSVRSAQDIPAGQLDAARNFVAAYALEGDLIEADARPGNFAGIIGRPLSPIERWMVYTDFHGNEQYKPIPPDACVMTRRELLQVMVTPDEIPVSTEELFELVMAAMSNLKARSAGRSQAAQQPAMRARGLP